MDAPKFGCVAPLKESDKKLQDARIFANGPPTIPLWYFIDSLLADAVGTKDTLPIFYRLVEAHGLVVYDKVMDGQIISTNELLNTLRQQEQQADKLFDDDSFQFWETLAKESKYSVLRGDVAMAYGNAGESEFPWLNWNDELVLLAAGKDGEEDPAVTEPASINDEASNQDDSDALTVQKKKFEYPETTKWKAMAWEIGEEWMKKQREAGKDPGVIEIAKYIEDVFSERDIRGKNGKWLDWETIKKEALTGITGKKPNGK